MTQKETFGHGRWIGIILIVISLVIWNFRPLSSCMWYNLFCQAGSFIISPIFLVLSILLAIVGVYKLIKG